MQDRKTKKGRGSMMKDELLKEWNNLLDQYEDVYVYGASNTAKTIMQILKDTNWFHKFKGYLVTNKEDNPKELDGVSVTGIQEFADKNALILVPHLGIFKTEILKLLKELGFVHVCEANHFLQLNQRNATVIIDDIYMQRAAEEILNIRKSKTQEELMQEQTLLREISQIRDANKPDFGKIEFYQSMETVGIIGQRPSLYRIYKYGLDKILDCEKTVLDIGCNSGFLDLSIAPLVKSVTGIEYDSPLVQIGEKVKEYLNRDNCLFVNMDFKNWNSLNENKYDIILSLAVHHWIGLTADEYVEILDSILQNGGYLCLESHNSETTDDVFEKMGSIMFGKGYQTVNQGSIQDDGLTKRKYVLLRKNSFKGD